MTTLGLLAWTQWLTGAHGMRLLPEVGNDTIFKIIEAVSHRLVELFQY